MTVEMRDAALDYLRGGHHLLALRGKRPHPLYHQEWSWDNSFHGDPTGHEEELEFIFASATGIAILIPEHVLVADIDTSEAAALFRDLAGDIPRDTAIARTTKGLHVWYVAPGAKASRWLGDRSLLFKGFGGYVAVEPSAHFTDDTLREQDGTYTWLSPLTDGLAFLPEGIAERFHVLDALEPFQPKGEYDRMHTVVDGLTMWQEWNLDGLKRAIIEAKDGNQNNMIAWAAMTARDEGVPYAVSMSELLDAALEGNHPRSRAVASIKGAYKRHRG